MTESSSPIVVGIDGSEHSLTALKRALAEAALAEAPLHVVYVSDVTPAQLHLPGEVTISTVDLAEAKQAEVWSRASGLLDDSDADVVRVNLDGYPPDELVEYTESVDAQLLVVGTRGRGRLASTLLGSTSRGAVERATCDVLVAKPR